MIRTRWTAAALLLAALIGTSYAGPELAPPPRQAPDLRGYKTTARAARANPKEFSAATAPHTPGYLGVVVEDRRGKPTVDAVEPDSPADAAGLRAGDAILKINGAQYTSAATARDALHARFAGDKLTLVVQRGGKTLDLAATLRPASRPMDPTNAAAAARAVMGITLAEGGAKGGGVKIDAVTPDMPAAKAGIKAGDVVTKFNGKDVNGATVFRELLGTHRPGDTIELFLDREGKREVTKVTLVAEATQGRGRIGWDDRLPNAWRKTTYRLAILGIEYPDVKHNPKVTDKDWEESMFSLGTYTGKSATGEKVHGSMNDYYKELSNGTFKIEGKFVGWVEVSKKRMEYTTGSGTDQREKRALLTEAMEKFTAKHKDGLKDYDGIFFLYAGGRVQTTRGGLYWPHRASVNFGGKRWPYFIVQEGGTRMNDISVFCHEFGHMLGLPDLYARPELPGSEGVGVWCAMSNQVGGGRPQHFCAWSKEQLGWVKPVVLDPRVKQRLILSPIEDDPTQCYKVMIRADGSEYFLLENRRKQGFDESLPGEGLLIWRVVNNRPVLEESHGVEGARGPRIFLPDVPFPSKANTAFTPFTTPSSRSQLGGGLPVYITNIRKLPDGRITFHIGYEYQ